MDSTLETTAFLKSIFDHAVSEHMSGVEITAFSEWFKEALDASPEGVLLASPLQDGKRVYAHYTQSPGKREYLYALSTPTLYVPNSLGDSYLPEILDELPCWLLGSGPVVATRF